MSPHHPLLDLSLRPVVGHRGNCAHAPENTIESFRQAVALGVEALEFDIRLTVDGQVVVMHDPTLDRTTSGAGFVAAKTLAEIQSYDAGARFTTDGGRSFPYRNRGITAPSLAEVLETFPHVPVLLEIKRPEVSAAARDVIKSLGAESRCLVAGYHHHAAAPFVGSGIAIGACMRDVANLLAQSMARIQPKALPYVAMSIPPTYAYVPLPMRQLVETARGAGVPVHVWTVNDPAEALALWDKGVRGILSDDPGPMLKARPRGGLTDSR